MTYRSLVQDDVIIYIMTKKKKGKKERPRGVQKRGPGGAHFLCCILGVPPELLGLKRRIGALGPN